MTTAFVLITTEIDAMEKVLQALRDVDDVTEAYSLYGAYDVIARINAQDASTLKEIVFRRIRRLSGVRNTVTLTTIERI